MVKIFELMEAQLVPWNLICYMVKVHALLLFSLISLEFDFIFYCLKELRTQNFYTFALKSSAFSTGTPRRIDVE